MSDEQPRYIRIDKTDIGRAVSVIVADPKLSHEQMKKTAKELFDHAAKKEKREWGTIA